MNLTKEGRKRLAKLMVIQEVSQRQLAERIGWSSHSYIGRLLRGEVTSVTPEVAAKIAAVFQVGIDEFFLVKTSTSPVRSTQSHKVAA